MDCKIWPQKIETSPYCALYNIFRYIERYRPMCKSPVWPTNRQTDADERTGGLTTRSKPWYFAQLIPDQYWNDFFLVNYDCDCRILAVLTSRRRRWCVKRWCYVTLCCRISTRSSITPMSTEALSSGLSFTSRFSQLLLSACDVSLILCVSEQGRNEILPNTA